VQDGGRVLAGNGDGGRVLAGKPSHMPALAVAACTCRRRLWRHASAGVGPGGTCRLPRRAATRRGSFLTNFSAGGFSSISLVQVVLCVKISKKNCNKKKFAQFRTGVDPDTL
jgi:hypothetical protein